MSILLEAEPADAGKRLDWFLHERLPAYSRSRLQGWIKEDRVRLNGEPARASYALRGGEQINVTPGPLPALKAIAQELPLDVLYEDDDVIVVDKPAGVVVHAGAGHHEGTLVNALLHRFGSLSSVGGDLRPGIVHRLDKDTSGVLVVARHDAAHQSLAAQFQSREVEKIYIALAHGEPSPATGVIRAPIARDPVRRTRMTTRLKTGRSAITEYRIIERIGSLSLLEIRIGTGRTHQIRVHLSSIGYPIVGDTLYGAPKTVKSMPPLGRFFLHARSLRFRSPSKGSVVQVQSPLAAELESWLEQARMLAQRV
jgi:23S rRNA pseudouridine1911/1915/1917 synthase